MTLIARETWADVGHITIGPKGYSYRRYPGDKRTTSRTIVRLFTDNGFSGDSYDVSFHAGRLALCTCADFEYRRKGETGETCRHIRGVVALGLAKTDAEFEADELDRLADVAHNTAVTHSTADLQGGFGTHPGSGGGSAN